MRKRTLTGAMMEMLEPRLLFSANPILTEADGDYGNTFNEATTAELDFQQTQTIDGAFQQAGDNDYLTFLAEQDGALKIDIQGISGDVNPFVYAYDSSLGFVNYNRDWTSGETSSILYMPVTAGEEYYLRIFDTARRTGDYELTVTYEEDEFADTRETATLIDPAADGTTEFTGRFQYNYDVDYVTFTADVTGGLWVDLDVTEGQSLYAYAYTGTGSYAGFGMVTPWSAAGLSRLALTVTEGETYTLKLYNPYGKTADYSFTTQYSPDDFANSFDTATAIDLNETGTTTLAGGFNFKYDYDYVTFTADVSGGLTIDIAPEAEGAALLYAYNSTGRYAGFGMVTPYSDYYAQANLVVEAGETYTLKLYNPYGNVGNYDLTFEYNPDDYGSSFDTATEVDLNETGTTTISGSYNYAGDYDYITFTADVTGGLSIDIAPENDGATLLYAYSSTGRYAGFGMVTPYSSYYSQANLVVTAGESYTLKLYNPYRKLCDYDLTFEYSPDDFGSTFETASEVDLNETGTTTVAGGFNYLGDYDYITFTADVSGGLTIDIAPETGGATLLYAYNSTGRYAGFGMVTPYSDYFSQASLVVTAGETYTLKVYNPYRELCDYDLTFEYSPDDFGNTFESATEVDLNETGTTTLAGSYNYTGDVDYVTFTADVSGGLIINIDALAENTTYAYAYNSQQSFLGFGYDATWSSAYDTLSLAVTAGQTYTLKLYNPYRDLGDYQLTFEYSPDEYGNTFETASTVTLDPDNPTTIEGSFNYGGDVDYVTFTADVSGGLIVDIDALGDNAVFLYAYNDQQAFLGFGYETPWSSTYNAASLIVTEGESYTLKLYNPYRDFGDYQLTFTYSPDDYADTFDTATETAVASDTTTVIDGSFNYNGDVDYITFTAQDNGLLSVQLDTDEGDSVMLYAYNQTGGFAAFAFLTPWRTNYDQTGLVVAAGQSYVLKLSNPYATVGNYSLTFDLTVDEHGNTAETATTLSLDTDTPTTVHSEIEYADDEDYFTFTADGTGELVVDMQDDGSGLDSYLYVYDSQGHLLARNDDITRGNLDSQVRFNVTAAEDYYVRASAYYVSTGAYALTFDYLVDEHGNSTAEASALALDGTTTTLHSRIDYANDVDYFALSPATDGQLTVDMEANGSGLDSYLYVYNSAGQLITANDDIAWPDLDSRVQFTVTAGETYYLAAAAYFTSTGEYDLTLSFTEDTIGETHDTAATLPLDDDGAGQASSAIDHAGDVDMFAFTATASEDITLAITSDFIPRLWVTNAAGVMIAQYNSDFVNHGECAFAATAGQTYYVEVYTYNDLQTGDYTLEVTTDIPAPPPDPDPMPDGDVSPGENITAGIFEDDTGTTVFRIVGTDNADEITVRQAGTTWTLELAGGATYSYSGNVEAVVIYGFAGDDVLRTEWSVSAEITVYAGMGNDTVYENAQASATVHGQGGDDLLISIGGGSDTLLGSDGLDSYWLDASDAVNDATSTETAANAVHTVSSFYQPWTVNPAEADYIDLDIQGQNFRDPSAGGTYRNFADREVFVDGPQYNDIEQGAIGDCYYLASLASLADTDPTVIEQMITHLGDGTYAVRFFRNGQQHYLRIDADLPSYSSTNLVYAEFTPDGEIWVPLVEKAYAHFRYGQDSYSSISGGWMDTVYEEVTGEDASWQYAGSMSTTQLADYIRTRLNSGYSMSCGSYSGGYSPIVGSHAYMIHSIDAGNYVTVYNPWGVDGQSYDGNYYDGLLRLSISTFQSAFYAITTVLV